MAAAPKRKIVEPSGVGAGNEGGCRPAFQTSDQTTLRKLLECPICKRVAKPPIYTCEDDKHLFCGEDQKNLAQGAQCPICKSPISETRSTYIEQCMDGILLECANKEDGCQRNLKATEYRDHLLVCFYREIQCFMLNCGASVKFKEFFNHLKTNHKDKVNGIENANRHVVEWWIEGDSSDASARWPPYFFTCFDNVFLYTAISTAHGMWEWAYILGDDAEASRFQVVSNITSSDKTSELRWKGVIHPIGKPLEEIAESGLCFLTNSKEMRNPYIFKKKNNQRHYWRTDVEIVELAGPKPGAIPYIATTQIRKTDVSPGKLVATGTSARRLSWSNEDSDSYDYESMNKRGQKDKPFPLMTDADPKGSKVKSDRKSSLKTSDEIPIPKENVKKERKLSKVSDDLPSTSEKIKGARRLSKIGDEIPSTSEKGKIPLSDIGNQNEESPRPKTRQPSVKMLEPEPVGKYSEEIAAEGEISNRTGNIKDEEDDKEIVPQTPVFDSEEARKRHTFFKISDLEDDRYFESDNTN